jgi:hypothetical protein
MQFSSNYSESNMHSGLILEKNFLKSSLEFLGILEVDEHQKFSGITEIFRKFQRFSGIY